MSKGANTKENEKVIGLLNRIYQNEIAGVNQYLHYSFVIMGYNRIPIQKWFRENATESMTHAIEMGEKITSLGGHPTMVTREIEEHHDHSIDQLLAESLKLEENAIALYKELAAMAEEMGDIALEELARTYVKDEVEHRDEIAKMMQRPS